MVGGTGGVLPGGGSGLRPRTLATRRRRPRQPVATSGSTTKAASSPQLVTYTLYRFDICVRATAAVVGVIGAAGRAGCSRRTSPRSGFPVLTPLLAASLAVSAAVEVLFRPIRRVASQIGDDLVGLLAIEGVAGVGAWVAA